MQMIPERFRHNELFIIMFFFTVAIVIIVSISISYATIRMSENFFIEKFSITNSKVMSQISDRLENYHYAIVLSSNNIIQSSTIKNVLTEQQSNQEKMQSFYRMDQQMKYWKTNLDTYQTEIVLDGINGVSYSSNRTYFPMNDEELKNSILRKNTLDSPRKIIYQSYQLIDKVTLENTNYIIASKALMDPLQRNVYGSMYFVILESEFRSFYSNYTTKGNNVYFMDKNGVILSSNEDEYIGRKQQEFIQYANEMNKSKAAYMIETFKGKDQIVLATYLPSFDMYIINLIDKNQAVGDLLDKRQLFLLGFVIVLIILVIAFYISRKLTNPLSRLVKEISSTSKSEFHQYVTVNGIYETREIAYAFNTMLDELHQYVDKLIISQKQQRNAELEALQQQINPHFLYNTLTSIKFIVIQGEKKEAEEVMNAFISLLQNTIGNVSELITVDQEIDILKNYVFINQKRYGTRITIHYFIDPNCKEYSLPKLILQPFIENAFFHGFNKKESGFIHILIWREQERLVCEVVDNGDGFSLDHSKHLPTTKRNQQLFNGIGVRNVDERVKLLFGKEYGVEISSEIGKGTKVKITFPLPQNNN
ncbi:sensor histidine kinase [Bacillus sp. B1-b2]|uniref:sensor histidine kinase n=1 Tax=Bacillus sp. B1-b2 TaxID=2653201 RepID=UPI001261C140|nr:sensor histidine kinase [Bacillus sp. B1-b2]KAB7666296.1 sensor histidine kinase [Bacillus sp. B1-b2]